MTSSLWDLLVPETVRAALGLPLQPAGDDLAAENDGEPEPPAPQRANPRFSLVS